MRGKAKGSAGAPAPLSSVAVCRRASGEEKTVGTRTRETGGSGVGNCRSRAGNPNIQKWAGHFKIVNSQMSHWGQLTPATDAVSR